MQLYVANVQVPGSKYMSERTEME